MWWWINSFYYPNQKNEEWEDNELTQSSTKHPSNVLCRPDQHALVSNWIIKNFYLDVRVVWYKKSVRRRVPASSPVYIYIYMLAMRGVRDRGAKRQVPTVQYIFACMLHWSSSIYTNQSLERWCICMAWWSSDRPTTHMHDSDTQHYSFCRDEWWRPFGKFRI